MTDKPEADIPVLEVYRDDICSTTFSSAAVSDSGKPVSKKSSKTQEHCCCVKKGNENQMKVDHEAIEKLLQSKEAALKNEFEKRMEKETNYLKERFDFILQNEQIRASYMLREAYRERQEKVSALQTQLECKNLSGLMYVMCSEKRKSNLEKMRIIEEYTNYIHTLQDILTEAQNLILHLSRGYKTAARVDHEWRQKMTKIIKEFLLYVYHFGGGSPETNQYLFDLPALMKIEASIVDNPKEDPCEIEEEEEKELSVKEENKNWWDRLDDEDRPFIMFGDMAEFQPPQRRQVLKTVKAAKTAPRKWKEYVFNDMMLKSKCPNADFIKDEYPNRLGSSTKWECSAVQTEDNASRMSMKSRRVTGQSVDIRGDMGSILKIITSHGLNQPVTKAVLLGARDSLEITSTTKLREKIKHSDNNHVVINVGARRTSPYGKIPDEEYYDDDTLEDQNEGQSINDEEDSATLLGSTHVDSLQFVNNHVKDMDHRINYEKVCPMEKCQRLHVDSFMKSLPSYMKANPFTHFTQTFEGYETCSPEQIEILKHRLEESKKKDVLDRKAPDSPPQWECTPRASGVAVQTSAMSLVLPRCTCGPGPSPASSYGNVFRMDDLIPVKLALDRINKECFFDNKIEFDRFKVIGEDSNIDINMKDNQSFNRSRVQEIQQILKQHPSLVDIFQANTQC